MGRRPSHGHSGKQPCGRYQSLTYTSWRAAMQRCHNPNHVKYAEYGAKGIKVHERWHKFENFLADMGERPSREHTLGRSTPFSDYAPRECTWQTTQEQNKAVGELKTKRKIVVTAYGLTMTLEEWAAALGVKWGTFRKYLTEGKDPYARAAEKARGVLRNTGDHPGDEPRRASEGGSPLEAGHR